MRVILSSENEGTVPSFSVCADALITIAQKYVHMHYHYAHAV